MDRLMTLPRMTIQINALVKYCGEKFRESHIKGTVFF